MPAAVTGATSRLALRTIPATDYHTGGEPFRIVADPPVPIPGRTVAERRARAIEDPAVQGLRAVLCSEPLVPGIRVAVTFLDPVAVPARQGSVTPTG